MSIIYIFFSLGVMVKWVCSIRNIGTEMYYRNEKFKSISLLFRLPRGIDFICSDKIEFFILIE